MSVFVVVGNGLFYRRKSDAKLCFNTYLYVISICEIRRQDRQKDFSSKGTNDSRRQWV